MQSTMSSEEADQIARAVSRVLQSRVQGKKGERCRQQWPVLEQGQGARGKEQGTKEEGNKEEMAGIKVKGVEEGYKLPDLGVFAAQ